MKRLCIFSVAMAAALGAFAADEPLTPSDVSDPSVVWNFNSNAFDVSFTAPTTGYVYDFWDTVYEDLTAIDRIEVARYMGYYEDPVVLHTFSNPSPGEKLSCEISSLPAGGTYSFLFTVFADGEQSDGRLLYDVLAGGYPEAIANPTVTTTNGAMPVTVSFTAPDVYKGTDYPLPSLTSITLMAPGASYWDPDVELASIQNPEPGKEYTLTVDRPDLTGTQNWKLYAYNETGASDPTAVKVFIGQDAPGLVTGLKAVEKPGASILISWSAPESGANNGFFNPNGITYSLYKKTPGSWGDNTELIASGIEGLSYEYPFTAQEITRIAFAVTATNADGTGPEAKTPYMLAGPAYDLPFLEGFDSTDQGGYSLVPDHEWVSSSNLTSSYAPEWRYDKYKYVGNSQVTPPSGEGGLAYLGTYSYTEAGAFSLTSAKISLLDVPAVSLSFNAYGPGMPAGSSLDAAVSFDLGASFVPLAHLAGAAADGWTRVSGEADVPSGAEFAIIRITANSVTGVDNTFVIDEIDLHETEAQAIIYPSSVSDLNAVMEDDAIIITMVAPELSHPTLGDVNSEPLQSITKIILGRQIGYGNDYLTIHTFENPAPGEHLEYVDTDLAQGGEYRYRALVYIGDRCDYGNYTDQPITVGQIPGEVTDFTATTNRGAAPVILSFRAPSTDADGQPLKAIKSISISKYDSENFVWTVIEELTDDLTPGEVYTYTDPNVISGEVYEYRVAVAGSAGNSYGTTRSVFVGIDEPLAPIDIKAEIGPDSKVVVTWGRPEAGINNGYVDFDNLTYAIYRGNGYSDYYATLLKSGLRELTFTDPETFTEEQNVRYFVKAINGTIQGTSGMSNLLLVGDPSELPYVENFDREVDGLIEPEHGAWTTSSPGNTPVWAFAELAYLINEGQVQPVNGGKGLAYAYYGPYSSNEREDYLTSGRIAVGSAKNLTLEFYVYGVPGYDQTLDAEVSFDGGDFESVLYINYPSDFQEEGWVKETVRFDVPEGSETMQLRMHAHKGAYSCSVVIDNIRISDTDLAVRDLGETLAGSRIHAEGGRIAVEAPADATVAIAEPGGRLLHAGKGSCVVPATPGIYLININGQTRKITLQAR